MKKILIIVASVTMFLAMLSPTTALAASPIVNGSFETGDYTGWILWEGKPDGWDQNGTWGIAYDGETINPGDSTYDFCDETMVTQRISPGLPITYVTTDGDYLAYQLQAGPQDHRMYQDVELPASAKTLSWDMFYKNYAGGFSGSQYLAVHIRDLGDNVLGTLFITEEGDNQSMPMTHFTCDISAYAGSTVRIDVKMVTQVYFLDAGFDNFVIGQDEFSIKATAGDNGTISPSGDVTVDHGDNQTFSITAEAGYHIDDVLVDGDPVGAVDSFTFTSVEADHIIYAAFAIDTYTEEPPGWAKESKEGWNGSVPPGLEKKNKTPPGFDKGKKTGWK